MTLTILIVDDSPADRHLINHSLTKAQRDIKVLMVESAQEALTMIQADHVIDCMFLDYRLPGMDGADLLTEIYDKNTDLGPCPIVMLTGQASESAAIEAIRLGAQDYITKDNISTDTLFIAIAKACEVYELKRAHNEAKAVIEHTQKMEAVGNLAGGIAHDFNNLLTITFGNARLLNDLLQREKLDTEACLKKVDSIQKATRRGADLVKHLMLFSRQRTLEPEIVDLNDLVTNLLALLGRTLGDFIEIETDLCPGIGSIKVDTGQLENAIINMGVNARDAMMDGGKLGLATENITIDSAQARLLKIPANDYVCLSITDTGTGIAEDVLSNIFDPFFTTKGVGQGTGLGLSMVYGFVKESGGGIHVESEEKQGTIFKLYFPRTEERASAGDTQSSDNVPQPEGGQETILVVEDEEEIRFLTANLLNDAGYTVIEAANGNDALSIIQNTEDDIHLVFTDIVMPGDMNGVQMAARAQALRPNIKLLFTTGYAAGAFPDSDLAQDYPILHKPYHPDDLMQKIRDVIE